MSEDVQDGSSEGTSAATGVSTTSLQAGVQSSSDGIEAEVPGFEALTSLFAVGILTVILWSRVER
jgi:hypothetical protein